jgi:cytochrome c-type biogenesis protein CcmH/NrfG
MKDIEAGLAQTIALLNAGQNEEAEALCNSLLSLHPQNAALNQLAAVVRAGRQRWSEARAHIQRSLASRPQHLPSLQIAARIAREMSDAPGLRDALAQIARLQPHSAAAWFALSLAFHDTRDTAAEQEALERVLALEPAHVEALVNLGIVRQERGDLGGAMHCYGRAYRLRADTFGRITNALCSERTGALWLDLDALRQALAVSAAH